MEILDMNKQHWMRLIMSHSLGDYISVYPKNDVELVKRFLSDDQLGKILIIKSSDGEGETHLLLGAARELLNDEIKFVFNGCSIMGRIFNIEKDSFEKDLRSSKFCFVDYIDDMHEHCYMSPPAIDWLKRILSDFIREGGKLILSGSKEMEARVLRSYFQTELIIEIHTSPPTLETLRLIGKQHTLNENDIEEHANKIFSTSKNVREFIGYLIGMEALRMLKALREKNNEQ